MIAICIVSIDLKWYRYKFGLLTMIDHHKSNFPTSVEISCIVNPWYIKSRDNVRWMDSMD